MSVAGRLEAFLTVPSGISISATNSGGGPTAVSLTAGTYTPTSFVAHVVARLNAVRTPANWTGSLSTGAGGTGFATLNCTGTWSIAWTSTDARDMLGFTGDIASVSSAQTGTKTHRGLWLPDCPLNLAGDPARAPVVSDIRRTRGPTGYVVTYFGNKAYRHRELVWSHVARAKTWESVSSIKGSWEQWFKDTQLGNDHAWFAPGSAFHVYEHNSVLLGSDLNSGSGPANGWKISEGPTSIEPVKSAPPWVGYWRVEIAAIESDG